MKNTMSHIDVVGARREKTAVAGFPLLKAAEKGASSENNRISAIWSCGKMQLQDFHRYKRREICDCSFPPIHAPGKVHSNELFKLFNQPRKTCSNIYKFTKIIKMALMYYENFTEKILKFSHSSQRVVIDCAVQIRSSHHFFIFL